jgi:hypothetical protein
MTTLKEFTSQVNGAKYKLGLKKLMTAQRMETSR